MIPKLIGSALGLILAIYLKDDISGGDKKKLKGKHIAVLGTVQVGKTTFLDFLETGKITKNYSPTQAMEAVNHTREICGMKFSYNDVGGAIEVSKNDWLELIESSNIILYFMNINKVLLDNKQEIDHIRSDIREIEEVIRARYDNKNISIILVANHSDEQPEYRSNYGEFVKNVADHPFINESRLKLGGTKKVRLVVGSLVDIEEAEKLSKSIFNSK